MNKRQSEIQHEVLGGMNDRNRKKTQKSKCKDLSLKPIFVLFNKWKGILVFFIIPLMGWDGQFCHDEFLIFCHHFYSAQDKLHF